MKPPLAIAFIALLFSGCAVQVQQNRVCRAKIKQTKALLSELVPQDSIDGRVCMLRPMEDELRLVVRENEACFYNRNIQEFLCDFEGHVFHQKNQGNGTDYMIDLLYLVRDQRTFRTNLEQEMSHFRAQSLQNAYELIRANYQLPDSSAVLAQDLSMVDGFALELNAAFATLAGGASGSSVLNNLNGYSNDFNASFESSQLGALLALQEAMWLSDRAWMDATNAEVLALEGIADHYMTYAGRMAQEILNHHFEQHWFVPPAIGGLWTPRSVRIAAAEGNNEPALKLYPNPASVIVTVELTLPGNAAGATFRVYDARGNVVHERSIERNYEVFSLNTSQWASATYSFELIAAGSRKTGKFVIQH